MSIYAGNKSDNSNRKAIYPRNKNMLANKLYIYTNKKPIYHCNKHISAKNGIIVRKPLYLP
jgi:hypothetical protein